MNTGGWIARAAKLPVITPAVSVSGASRSPDGLPVLLLHGFTGNAKSMAPLAERLEKPADAATEINELRQDELRQVIAVDLIGHGATQSPPDIGRYSLTAFVGSLDAVLAATTFPKAHVVGYSLGGRAALTFASERPQRCASLTLIGATPGIADTSERLDRRRNDYALAGRIARHGVANFVREWISLPMWDSLRKRIGPAAWQASLVQRASSHPLGLAHSLRAAGTGAMTPLWGKLGGIAVPTLALAGEEDTKFCGIGAELAQQMPDCEFVAVPDAGHAAHLEQPDVVGALVSAHINRHSVS